MIQDNEFTLNRNDLKGKGGFGKVYGGDYANMYVAIKEMDKVE